MNEEELDSIEGKSETYKKFYELFKYCDKPEKACIVTDKMCFIRDVDLVRESSTPTHNILMMDDSFKLGMTEEPNTFGKDNIHIILHYDYAFGIIAPWSQCVGFGQLDFMEDLIDAFDDVHRNFRPELFLSLDGNGIRVSYE